MPPDEKIARVRGFASRVRAEQEEVRSSLARAERRPAHDPIEVRRLRDELAKMDLILAWAEAELAELLGQRTPPRVATAWAEMAVWEHGLTPFKAVPGEARQPWWRRLAEARRLARGAKPPEPDAEG